MSANQLNVSTNQPNVSANQPNTNPNVSQWNILVGYARVSFELFIPFLGTQCERGFQWNMDFRGTTGLLF